MGGGEIELPDWWKADKPYIIINCLEGLKDIPNQSVDMILSDLPYGITQNNWDCPIPLNLLWTQYNRVIKENGVIVLTAVQPFTSILVSSNLKMFKYSWYWKKGNKPTGFLNAKKQPLRIIEEILIFYKQQCIYNPQMIVGSKCHSRGKNNIGRKDKYQTNNYNEYHVVETNGNLKYPQNLIEFSRDSNKLHPTQKPVALFEYLIKTYTKPNAIVLDTCLGSGTTLIACMNVGRVGLGFEIDESCKSIIKNRVINEVMPKLELFGVDK